MANIDSGVETECESSDNSLSMESSKFGNPELSGKIPLPPVIPSLDMMTSANMFIERLLSFSPVCLHLEDHYPTEEHQNKIRHDMKLRREARRWSVLNNFSNLRSILDERKLRLASSWNNTELVDKLLKVDKVNPKAADAAKRTALHIASSKGYKEIVKLLLDHGADPNQKDIIGNTPLHLAVCTNHVDIVTMLLNAGTDAHSFDKYGRTPLHLAQSKLKLMQGSGKSCNSDDLKSEVLKVINMLEVYLKKSGQTMEADFVIAFATRLSLTQTKQEVDTSVRELLSNLSQLSLHKTES